MLWFLALLKFHWFIFLFQLDGEKDKKREYEEQITKWKQEKEGLHSKLQDFQRKTEALHNQLQNQQEKWTGEEKAEVRNLLFAQTSLFVFLKDNSGHYAN